MNNSSYTPSNIRSQSMTSIFDQSTNQKDIRSKDFLIPIRLEKKASLVSPRKNLPLKELQVPSQFTNEPKLLLSPQEKSSLGLNLFTSKESTRNPEDLPNLHQSQSSVKKLIKDYSYSTSNLLKTSGQFKRKGSEQTEFKPFVSERDGVGKLLQSVSLHGILNIFQEVGPSLKTNKLPTIFQTQRMLENLKCKLATNAKVNMTKTLQAGLNFQVVSQNKNFSNELSISDQDDHFLSSNNETFNSNKKIANMLQHPMLKEKKSRNDGKNFNPQAPTNQLSYDSNSISFNTFKLNEQQIDSYARIQALGNMGSDPYKDKVTLGDYNMQQNRMVMLESYQKLQKKLYESTYRKRDKNAPKLNNYNTDLLAKSLYHQQPTIGTYDPEMNRSQSGYLPSLKQSQKINQKESFANQNEKIKHLMSQGNLIDKPLFDKTSIKFGMKAKNLRGLSTEELIHLTNQSYNKKGDKTDKPVVNEGVKNILKEGKYEFHHREKTLGLTTVPLERPLDGRNQIKGIILDIRTNINKISF